jgi:hypothetical protein
MGQSTCGAAPPASSYRALTPRRDPDLLVDVLTGLLRPTAPREVDGPARMSLAAPDADLIRRLLHQTLAGGGRLGGAGGVLEQLAGRVLESLASGDDRLYSPGMSSPEIFLDAIHVKTARGADRAVYVAVAGDASGRQDVIGLCTIGSR